MKRLLSLFLVCLILLSGCAAGPEPALEDMLGTTEGSTYTAPFGFTIDGTDLYIFPREDLAAVNGLAEFTAEALMTQIDLGNAVTTFAAAPGGESSVTLSLFPAAGLPENVETAADYADYGLTVMPEKLTAAGYTNVQLQRVEVQLDDGAHPAVLCSADLTGGYSYHLLQICFRKGDWMGGLSLSSLESEEALRELLTRITSTN